MNGFIVEKLTEDHPELHFSPGPAFMWSPREKTVFYESVRLKTPTGLWSMLHEIGHATANHQEFKDDLDLLKIEVEAWSEARRIAEKHDITIDEDHIEDCLDSYRDWLKARSTCPDCRMVCLQQHEGMYQCFNCGCAWSVPHSPLCSTRTRTHKK